MVPGEKSAGIVPCFRAENTRLFLLLLYPQGHWGFPKGHVENGESLWETACRELEEETGLSSPERLGETTEKFDYHYTFNNQVRQKTVVFFPARVTSREVTLSHEHEDYLWQPRAATGEQITYREESEMFENLLPVIKSTC